MGLVGRCDFLVEELLPIQAREPLCLLDVVNAVLQVTEALSKICSEQFLHQNLGILVEELGEDNLATQNLLIDAHGVLVHEWWIADDHLIDEDAKAPPIHWFTMTLVEKHLRCDVLG